MRDDPFTYVYFAMIFIGALVALMVTLFAVMEFFRSWEDGLKMLGVAMFLWLVVAGHGLYLRSAIRSGD